MKIIIDLLKKANSEGTGTALYLLSFSLSPNLSIFSCSCLHFYLFSLFLLTSPSFPSVFLLLWFLVLSVLSFILPSSHFSFLCNCPFFPLPLSTCTCTCIHVYCTCIHLYCTCVLCNLSPSFSPSSIHSLSPFLLCHISLISLSYPLHYPSPIPYLLLSNILPPPLLPFSYPPSLFPLPVPPPLPYSLSPFSLLPFSPLPISPLPFSSLPFSPLPISPLPFSSLPFSPLPISPLPFSSLPFSSLPFSLMSSFLGADDILPYLIYLILLSSPKHIHSNLRYVLIIIIHVHVQHVS